MTNEFSFNVGGNLKARSSEARDGSGLGALKASDLTSVFNLGATWSYSTSFSNASAGTNVKPMIAANKCGYWTFVPYIVT